MIVEIVLDLKDLQQMAYLSKALRFQKHLPLISKFISQTMESFYENSYIERAPQVISDVLSMTS